MRELRYVVRSLLRLPAFTIATVLTLAIGIGAATAIYSVVDTILFRPLPFPGGDRLVRLVEYGPHFREGQPPVERGINYLEYLGWRDGAKTIEQPAAIIGMSQRMVSTPDGAAGMWGAMVSGNLFTLLHTRPHLGRTIQASDDTNQNVIVLSYDIWRRHYHADPSIIGRTLEVRMGALLNARPPMFLMVIGVLPQHFDFPTGTLDFVMPINLDPGAKPPGVMTIARLAEGASIESATQEANTMGTAMRPAWPADRVPPSGPRFEYQSIKERLVAPLRPALRVILAAVGVLLLIVCANAANLLLARGVSRRREIAVRLAVGASRIQVFRQVLLESAVLASAGGLLGAALGASGVVLVRELATIDAPGIFRLMFGANILPRANEVSVDLRLFGISFATAALTSFIFGLLPALQLARADHLRAMDSRGSSSRAESRLRSALMLAQLTMATVLLTGAALLTHSFIKLSTFNKGYDPANVLAFNLLFPDTYSTPRRGEAIEQLLARFRSNPDVRAAGFARHGLLIGEELYLGTFVPPGKTLAEVEKDRGVRTRSVSDGFLTAMGVPILQGRDLAPTDSGAAPGAIVINRSAARRYFGDANPIGRPIEWVFGKTHSTMTVVGVAEDVRQEAATDPLVPEIFVDYRQFLAFNVTELPARHNEFAIGFLSFAVRTDGDPSALIPAVRESVVAVDPNIGIDAIVPMEQLEASSRSRERFYAVMLGVFAIVSAVLAAIGVYGMLAYAVTQRTKEIGVRMALGAGPGDVLGLIMRRALALATVGIVLGLAIAAAGARSIEAMLFGVKPIDPATFAAVAAGFTMVAALASYFPARHATRVDPAATLRDD